VNVCVCMCINYWSSIEEEMISIIIINYYYSILMCVYEDQCVFNDEILKWKILTIIIDIEYYYWLVIIEWILLLKKTDTMILLLLLLLWNMTILKMTIDIIINVVMKVMNDNE